MKLHGSLSWYSVPGDTAGSTLARWRLPGTFGEPTKEDEKEQRVRALPGRRPFIVPPGTLKSVQLRKPVVRQVWTWASEALQSASRVVLLGYSLPTSDTSFGGILVNSLQDKWRQVRPGLIKRFNGVVEVVNPDGRPIVERLVRLGVPEESLLIVGDGDDKCIAKWTDGECERQAAQVVARFRGAGLRGDEMLTVDGAGSAAVARMVRHEHELVLELDRPAPGGIVAQPTRVAELVEELGEGVQRVVVEDEGRCFPVVDFWAHRQPTATTGVDEVFLLAAGLSLDPLPRVDVELKLLPASFKWQWFGSIVR